MAGFSPFAAMVVLVLVFYFTHYLFASITAHVTALLPVMLAVGTTHSRARHGAVRDAAVPHPGHHGHAHAVRHGPEPGLLRHPATSRRKDYWLLGAIFGVIFIAAFLLIGLPWMAMIR